MGRKSRAICGKSSKVRYTDGSQIYYIWEANVFSLFTFIFRIKFFCTKISYEAFKLKPCISKQTHDQEKSSL